MNIIKIIVAICSILFFMIGVDKFLSFLDPPCTLMPGIPTTIWYGLGVLQIAAGFLIWIPKYREYIAGFFLVLMLFFIVYHLLENTQDVGGAVFMAVLLALLLWNPGFLQGRNK